MERLALVLAIADYRRPNLSRGPSRDFLAFLSGLSVDRVTELLEELSGDGLISYGFKAALLVNTQHERVLGWVQV
jgi:hypothetical protein